MSSPCIPFTYLNKGSGTCQEGKYRLVRHAREHADVPLYLRMCLCVCMSDSYCDVTDKKKKEKKLMQIGCWYLAKTNYYRKSVHLQTTRLSTSPFLFFFTGLFFLLCCCYVLFYIMFVYAHMQLTVFSNMSRHLSAGADRLWISFFLLLFFFSIILFFFFTSCSPLSLIYNGEREAGDKRGEQGDRVSGHTLWCYLLPTTHCKWTPDMFYTSFHSGAH